MPKRRTQANDTRSYSSTAIFCGDSVDLNPHTNMTDVLNAVVASAQNVSHLCEFSSPGVPPWSTLTWILDTVAALWPYLSNQCALWPERSVERYSGPFNKTLANKILVASTAVRLLSRK